MLRSQNTSILSTRWSLSRQRLALAALVLAWLGIHSPQTAVLSALDWAYGASHFSHNDQLAQGVIEIMTGVQAPHKTAFVRVSGPTPSRPKPPVELATSSKIEIALEHAEEPFVPVRVDTSWEQLSDRLPEDERDEPEQEPPRSRA